MSDRRRPRVLLADDDDGMRRAISRLLTPSCDVLGCVSDTISLFETVAQLQPDVVVLDFSLPGGLNALEACRRLTTMMPNVHVVAFTAHHDAGLRESAYEAGASGFVWKLQAATDLTATIHTVVEGAVKSPETR